MISMIPSTTYRRRYWVPSLRQDGRTTANNVGGLTVMSDDSTVMMALPKDNPTLQSFERYQQSASYANTRRWAQHLGHVDGALWAAFLAGFNSGAPSDVNTVRDIARRATDVERERCLSEVESTIQGFDGGMADADCTRYARQLVINIGAVIAGGDAGPHSDAAVAWRRRVTGEASEVAT